MALKGIEPAPNLQ